MTAHDLPSTVDEAPSKEWSLELFAALTCRSRGVAFERFATRKAALLLIRLGLSGGAPVQRDDAALVLWPDEPADVSRPRLRQAVISLKRSFPEPESFPLMATKNELRLDGSAIEIDCAEFERLVKAGRDAEAIAMYRPLLPGWTEPWIGPYRRALEALFAQSVLRLAEQGGIERAVQILADASATHPFNEVLLAGYMAKLNDTGQQTRSIQAYENYIAALDAQSGIGPGSALRDLAEEAAAANRILLSVPIPIEAVPLPNPLTRMFGRTSTIAALGTLVASGRRLVTLTGIGGIGKTRVALEFAQVQQGYDSVAFVPLVQVAAIDLVFEGIHKALGIPSSFSADTEGTVLKGLSHRKVLLVLDSLEHLLPNVSRLVQGLLSSCPSLTIVGTSRVPLGIAGEQVVAVGPLGDIGDAAAMFLDRASLLSDTSVSDSANVAIARRIAKDLDGIPLAIELAAAQSGLYSLPEIESKLKDRLSFLQGGHELVEPRHARLEGVLAWSIESLPKDTRDVFVMLSVFHGTFTVESASAVFGSPVEQHIEVLRRRALTVDVQSSQTRRFRMLQTVREAARTYLDADAGRKYNAELRRYLLLYFSRHEPLFNSIARAAQAHLSLSEELENIRDCLSIALDEDPEMGLELAIQHGAIGIALGLVRDSRRWLEAFLLSRPWPATELAARAFFRLANAVGFHGEEDLELEYLRRSAEIAVQIDNRLLMALAGTNIAINLLGRSRLKAALAEAESSRLFWQEGSINTIVNDQIIATARGLMGDLDWARDEMQRILDQRLAIDHNVWTLSEVWSGVARLALEARDFEAAVPAATEAVQVLTEGGYRAMASDMLGILAQVLVAAGRTDEAWAVVGQLEDLGGSQGIPGAALLGHYFRGLLSSDRAVLIESVRLTLKLTRWTWAARAIQALAGQIPDRELAGQLLAAANQVRQEHGVELSVREQSEWATQVARMGIADTAPASIGELLRRAKRA